MKFKNNFIHRYLQHAPVPLALERTLECEILSKHVFEKPILDIGCGEGLFAHILFDEKIDVGIDPEPRELKQAEGLGGYSKLICCSGNKIPLENKSARTVLSNSVLEHIADIEPVLKEALRIMADDGSFYVTLPTNLFDRYSVINQVLTGLGLKSIASSFRKFFNSFWKHYHYYDENGWKELFQRNGFMVVSSIHYGTKSFCMVNDLLVPFTIPSFIVKKLVNRWTLFPGIRALLIKPLLIFMKDHRRNIMVNNSGLIFFHLKKYPGIH